MKFIWQGSATKFFLTIFTYPGGVAPFVSMDTDSIDIKTQDDRIFDLCIYWRIYWALGPKFCRCHVGFSPPLPSLPFGGWMTQYEYSWMRHCR